DEAKGVDVLQLGAGAKPALAGLPHGDVRVDAERALLHLRVRDAELDDRLPQELQEVARLLGRAEVGLRDDLDEGRSAAVEVDERMLGADLAPGAAPDVHRLRRVLLEVRSDDADLAVAAGRRDDEP